MHIQGKKLLYKGFLIVEYPEGTVNAYRSVHYLETGIASYSGKHGSSVEIVQAFIDVADDAGYFVPEQLDGMVIVTDGHKDELISLG